VGQQVRLQIRPLVEAPAADGALVRGLLHVEDLVHRQGPRLAEALAALRALEWFLLGVDVAVVTEVVLGSILGISFGRSFDELTL
jgi:hypothetical protein